MRLAGYFEPNRLTYTFDLRGGRTLGSLAAIAVSRLTDVNSAQRLTAGCRNVARLGVTC